MRKELEPNWEIAEKLYPEIVKLIEEYTDYCDRNGNEDDVEYGKLENKLSEITGKNISEYNISEYWEEEGLEPLAFSISLPAPVVVNDITKEELVEIVKIINVDGFEIFEEDKEKNFREEFKHHLRGYYHKLLELNFKNYEYGYFGRQKGKQGNYFEYSIDEIAEKIWKSL